MTHLVTNLQTSERSGLPTNEWPKKNERPNLEFGHWPIRIFLFLWMVMAIHHFSQTRNHQWLNEVASEWGPERSFPGSFPNWCYGQFKINFGLPICRFRLYGYSLYGYLFWKKMFWQFAYFDHSLVQSPSEWPSYNFAGKVGHSNVCIPATKWETLIISIWGPLYTLSWCISSEQACVTCSELHNTM